MAQKRKLEVTAVDETDRALYSTFRNVANQLSHLYSQALNHQKLAFEAGQRHALEKLSEWLAVKQQDGAKVTIADISAYLQNEMEGGNHRSNASDGRQNEMNISSSTAFMSGQDGEGNTKHSLDSDMEIVPEESIN